MQLSWATIDAMLWGGIFLIVALCVATVSAQLLKRRARRRRAVQKPSSETWASLWFWEKFVNRRTPRLTD